MPDPAFLAGAFLTGLAGSVHCAGMCGGIVVGLSAPVSRPATVIPIAAANPSVELSRHAGFNIGRLTTYAALGAAAGGFTEAGVAVTHLAGARTFLLVFAQLLLIALGIHLTGLLQPLAAFERAGAALWRQIQPLATGLLPVRSGRQAFLLGTVWGWLPCGMIYSMLLGAMASGSALNGALTMLAFGAGTVPMLLAVGRSAAGLAKHMRSPAARLAAGGIVIAFGFAGLARLSGIDDWSRLAVLCGVDLATGGRP